MQSWQNTVSIWHIQFPFKTIRMCLCFWGSWMHILLNNQKAHGPFLNTSLTVMLGKHSHSDTFKKVIFLLYPLMIYFSLGECNGKYSFVLWWLGHLRLYISSLAKKRDTKRRETSISKRRVEKFKSPASSLNCDRTLFFVWVYSLWFGERRIHIAYL